MQKKLTEIYYAVVMYENDQELPYKFGSREAADAFIFRHSLHAYITMKEGPAMTEALDNEIVATVDRWIGDVLDAYQCQDWGISATEFCRLLSEECQKKFAQIGDELDASCWADLESNPRNSEKGTYNGEPTYCTVNAYGECPYCDQEGICHIDNPIMDCEDFGTFFESWDEWLRS